MSKNRTSRDRIQSVQYNPRTSFQEHKEPGLNRDRYPLVAEENLDLLKAFAEARENNQKTKFFGDNAGAIKITAPHLPKAIIKSAVSEKILGDFSTGVYGGKLGHSERRVTMQALNSYIPAGEQRRPSDDYTSNVKSEQEFEKYSNLFEKAASYRSDLERTGAKFGLWTERAPCPYGKNNCNSFVNNISPSGSNVGYTANTQDIYDPTGQAAAVEGAYRQLQDSYAQYKSENPPISQPRRDQQPTFTIPNLPKPVVIPEQEDSVVRNLFNKSKKPTEPTLMNYYSRYSTPKSPSLNIVEIYTPPSPGNTPSPSNSYLWGDSPGSLSSDDSPYNSPIVLTYPDKQKGRREFIEYKRY